VLTIVRSATPPAASGVPLSSRYVSRFAPLINADGSYTARTTGRRIRVYTDLDVRLMFSDLFVKLRNHSR
jgi:purine nucleosidase